MNKKKKQASVKYLKMIRQCKRTLKGCTPYVRASSAIATRKIIGRRRLNRIKAERMMILADCPACFEKFSWVWDCRPHPVKANERIEDDFCHHCRYVKRGGKH